MSGNLSQCISQKCCVILADGYDDFHHRRADHIGSIRVTTHASLQNNNITVLIHKM